MPFGQSGGLHATLQDESRRQNVRLLRHFRRPPAILAENGQFCGLVDTGRLSASGTVASGESLAVMDSATRQVKYPQIALAVTSAASISCHHWAALSRVQASAPLHAARASAMLSASR